VAKHPAKCPKCGTRLEFDSAVDERLVCSGCGAALAAPGRSSSSGDSDPLIGKRLGEFEVVELLGRGGMGAVYKARQASLDRFVALKVLPQALSRDASFVERFGREARSAAAVSHPNIIEIHAVGEQDSYQFIAMELVEGETLGDVLSREGRVAVERAMALMRQVAAALATAHGAGMLHRDIKPSNILIKSDGLAKVADFGLAKRTEVDISVTATGVPLGTPLYLPPEVARGQAAEARSDLYSLGATFYQALAGRPPFQGTTMAEVAIKHVEATVPPLQQLAPDVPPALCRVIHRLLRKNPADRYPSAEKLLEALARLGPVGGVSVPRVPSAATHTLPPDARPRRATTARKRAVGGASGRRSQAEGGSRPRGVPRWLLIAGPIAAVALVVLILALRSRGTDPPPKAAVRPSPPALPTPRTSSPAAADPALERNAAIVFKNIQTCISKRDWKKAKGYLARLQTKYGNTQFAAAHKADIAALREQIDAARSASPPEPRRPKPDPPKPKPSEPTGRAPEPAAAQPPEPRPDDTPRVEQPQKPAPQPPALPTALDGKDVAERLAKLRAKMIERINTANPRLSKRSLGLKGLNADLVEADERGITTAKLPSGKAETFAWDDLEPDAVRRLAGYSAKTADDHLAAGILLLECSRHAPRDGTPHAAREDYIAAVEAAETHFAKAKAGGLAVDRYLDPLAAAAFAQAQALIGKQDAAKAKAALDTLEQKYAKTAWLAHHKDDVAAARRAVADILADRLYAQAAARFKAKDLWALKPVVEKLRADYPQAKAVTDGGRTPSFGQMAAAVAKLGKFLTVRQDGKGDFSTVQAALNAAEPNGLVEIADSGVYRERIEIKEHLEGLTLRGRRGCWPIFTSKGAKNQGKPLIHVVANGVKIEHLVLSDMVPSGSASCIRLSKGANAALHFVVLYGAIGNIGLRGCVIAGRNESHWLADCIQLAGMVESDHGTRVLTNCLVQRVRTITHGGIRLKRCTVLGEANSGLKAGYVADSIVESISFPGDSSVGPIIHSCVFGKKPYKRKAKPGVGCFSRDPQFRDPKRFDYRLKPSSPCRGKARDGGDIGCRYTPEMIEMLKLAFEMRKKGFIKF